MDNQGQLLVIGIGPGHRGGMTLDGMEALAASEVVIGYGPYLKQLGSLLQGKELMARGMRQELERCAEAIRLAKEGKVVALVSSGDAGIYGMAGPLWEMLLASGWREGDAPLVRVIPGVSAVSACSALVGAPLTHDFCTISLSDLLTPWDVICMRLEAAARADFVTALYNPRSRRRTQQLVDARLIFLQHRDPQTPVAIIRDGWRADQWVQLTDLVTFDVERVDMNTTLIIGNSRTFVQEGRMVTPRGYADKYGPLQQALEDEG
ncbi:MAG: precorrin-3B C(17)-methyltransferase [Magnetococcales bacterium]|nr:precorrin-3B C(17)-methyltransferase [Magnetococcales bacterium]NGZ25486.1 precorrin-3B C(17)-methyltransferase [Magnetococcales bacterium]